MTFRADKLPPPPKTESYTELYRWNYRLFELVNAIQSLIAAGVGNTAVGIITATNLQAVVAQLNTILSSITANLATTVASEETFGIADAVGVSTVYARQDHTHGSPPDPLGTSVFTDHSARHENGGADEVSVVGLSGLLADGQTPLAHKTSHENAGADELSVIGLSGLLADEQTPLLHTHSKHTIPYGSCWGNEIGWTQAAAVQNTWYEISDADMADGQLSGVTHDGSGKLTLATAGKYLVNYSCSAECNTVNKHIQFTISLSGTEQNDGMSHWDTGSPNQQFHVSGTAILSVTAGQTIEVSGRTTDAGTPDISVDHLNITVLQVGL